MSIPYIYKLKILKCNKLTQPFILRGNLFIQNNNLEEPIQIEYKFQLVIQNTISFNNYKLNWKHQFLI